MIVGAAIPGVVLAAAALLSFVDPRPQLFELQAADRLEEALVLVDQTIAAEPAAAATLGLHYMRGDLLSRMGENEASAQAFADAIAQSPKVAPQARFRIALAQQQLGHPETAASLTATLLSSTPPPPRSLQAPAAELLAAALHQGGDCRLLQNLPALRLPTPQRRQLALVAADCAAATGDEKVATATLITLLRERQTDLPGLLAAERLMALDRGQQDLEQAALLGNAFHHHRRFEEAVEFLKRLVDGNKAQVSSSREFDTNYQLVRGYYWLGSFDLAAAQYGDLARRAVTSRQAAQALFHRGRSLELAGDWEAAVTSFREAYAIQTNGSFAGASLLAATRLLWRLGREADALELYGLLAQNPQDRSERARAAVFFAASDVVRGRDDRTLDFLDNALAASRSLEEEVRYWRGRHFEVVHDPVAALGEYSKVVARDYYSPFAQAALGRIRSSDLGPLALTRADQQLAGGKPTFETWCLLPELDARRGALLDTLRQQAEQAHRGELAPSVAVAPEAWPLWKAALTTPEEMLLALGIWQEAGDQAVRKHFPLSHSALAFTASLELARAGRTRDSLRYAEILAKQIPPGVPEPLWPRPFRRALFPEAYRFLIEGVSSRAGADPDLLSALIREESRFDSAAVSGAAARGLTQFTLTTASQVADRAGLKKVRPADLHNPEISIALGAAYLASLSDIFAMTTAVIASYNAGEIQAKAWERYCYSDDPTEYLSKIAFQETRQYVHRVLRSYYQYRDLGLGA